MKFWDILRNVGGGIIENVVPGGNIIMGAINGLLPPDKQLPANTTGEQAQNAIMNLPPDQQAAIMNKEFDVQLEEIKQSHDTARTMLTTEAVSPHSTRPKIAYGSFQVVAFTVIVVISTWSYAVLLGKVDMLEAIVSSWGFILAVLAPLVTLLHAYFGVLKQEKKAVLDAATGASKPSVLGGILSALRSRK